jgi:hypothetical protein
VLTPEYWNNLFPGVWPVGQNTQNSAISVVPPPREFANPQTYPGEPTIYLQNLVPFFVSDGSTTNARTGNLVVPVPVDFVPPATQKPSSSATYIRR